MARAGLRWEERFRRSRHGDQPGATASRTGNWRGQLTGNLAQLRARVADGRDNRIEALLGGVGGHDQQAYLGITLHLRLGNGIQIALGNRRLRSGAPVCLFKGLAGAGQRVSLSVGQALDLQCQFYIAAAVEALAGSAFVGFKLGKLRLPKAQHIGLNAANLRHISDFEVKAVGDRRWRVKRALLGKLRGHESDEEDAAIWMESSL